MADYLSDASSDSESNSRNSEDSSYSNLSTIPDNLIPRAKEILSLKMNHNEILLLPPSISVFVNLLSLDLSNNHLTHIPKELISLRCLRKLLVKSNGLSCASIPKDFGLLSSLEVLNFSGNSLETFPPQFTELSNLRRLYLGGNCISEMPNSIKNLQRLEVLYLGGNRLTEVPAEIGQLYNLSCLILCDNQIQSIPPTLIQLRKLQSLSLHNNQISTLPPEIVRLNLSELSLRNNPLVNKFVQDMTYEPPTLLELSGRVIKIEKVKYTKNDLPSNLRKYLASAQRCVNPKCKGVYFTSRIEHVKFVDFCGKYRLPLLQYLCSPQCRTIPAVYHSSSDTETDEEEVANAKLRRVLLG
ncbi:leucine-rich repeat-containing protein 58-like [Saccostrea echinata]|uniref:leucine-rich repeat-containing protein 58-like n=1 Tax=Saccostrea echinata TaxID=191078 RepID=UPI002A7EB96E|nr:leucine-rich repeat-containing protein 58-like [Saccostrea echinata]